MASDFQQRPSTSTHLPTKVAEALRDRIRSGLYQPGEWLPAERELTDDMRVHRRVVRAAIAQLEREGLLLRRPNCRPIVQTPPVAVDDTPAGTQFPASRLVALVMWHGGGGATESAQQRIFWGMNQALGQAGYHGVFLDLGEDVGTEQENAQSEAAHLRYALDHGFGGIVFYAYAYESNRELIQEVSRRMPLVLIDRMVPGVEADFVGAENRQAMFDAVKYLVQQGHKRIAYVTKGESINPVHDRLQGYLRALREEFASDAYEMVLTAPFSERSTWSVFDTVFKLPADERPTAVLCVNDVEAMRVEKRLAELGLSVPGDVSLIGFDNIVRSLPSGVGLTTMAQPFEEIGKAACKMFLRRIEDSSAPPLHVELPVKLIERASSKPID
ncbi:MAG: regulatory protein LacI:Periplasmic binding protein/LacI transcriptional regulator [Capsulimonas sp.]|jgi:GntR family transcriptional regulator of arabinose operon|nr:regulatory protein LacI:Periplasmic binding protein/LacI transcriptional regulator [Capsulimonas sp.]